MLRCRELAFRIRGGFVLRLLLSVEHWVETRLTNDIVLTRPYLVMYTFMFLSLSPPRHPLFLSRLHPNILPSFLPGAERFTWLYEHVYQPSRVRCPSPRHREDHADLWTRVSRSLL